MSLPEILTTARLLLRPVTEADGPAVARHLGRVEVARMLTAVPHPCPPATIGRWFARLERDRAAGGAAYAVKSEGALIGCVSLSAPEGGALELGCWFAPEVWGRGFATEAAAALCDAAFTETGAAALHARRMADNPAAGRVLEKLGFVETGAMERHCEARGGSAACALHRLGREDWYEQAVRSAPRLKTARLALRPWRFEEADALVALVNDFEVTRWLAAVPHPYTSTDARRFIAWSACRMRDGEGWHLAIETKAGPVGCIGIGSLRTDPEIGWWLGRAHWGRGLATEAARALLAHAFEAGLASVRSGIFKGNERSFRVQEKLGFAVTGERTVYNVARATDVTHVDTAVTRERFWAVTGRTAP